MSTTPSLTSFDRAEYHNDQPLPDACAICERGLTAEYFRVGGHLACEPCAQQAQSVVLPDSHKAYSRALLFGAGAAVAACIGYALMEMTGYMIGYVAIGVGWVIGKAMVAGSRKLGGKRYQITAALLTYATISIAMLPPIIAEAGKQSKAESTKQQSTSAKDGTSSPAPSTAKPKPSGISQGGFLLACVMLLGIGLITPFLAFTASVGHGLFTLFFLYIGIQTAVSLTKKHVVEVDGPYEAVSTAS